jgi:hypothetical protein
VFFRAPLQPDTQLRTRAPVSISEEIYPSTCMCCLPFILSRIKLFIVYYMRINFFGLKIYRFILNLSILLLLFFVLTSLLKRLSIQYLRTCIIFFYNSSIHLTWFRRVKVINSFTSHKLLNLFENKFSTPFSIALSLCKEELTAVWCKVASLSFKTILLQTILPFPNF